MTPHVGAEALARYREGDLSGRKSARIRAHLAGCPRCTALDEDLAGVSAMLASAPMPVMPDQVTARIQAALTAEAARPARLAAGHEAGRPEQPGHSRHAAGRAAAGRRWRMPELLTPLAARAGALAAAAAVIAGGVYGAVQLAGGPPATSAGSASAAGAGQPPAAGNGPLLTYTQDGHPVQFTPVSVGRDFQPGLLKSQVQSLLVRAAPRQPGSRPQATTTHSGAKNSILPGSAAGEPTFGGIPLASLPGCVTRIAAGRQVLLVDVDRYQGKRATIIVVAGGGGDRVWVVGPGCSRSDSDVITQASLAGAG
jgi:hypothetical protein